MGDLVLVHKNDHWSKCNNKWINLIELEKMASFVQCRQIKAHALRWLDMNGSIVWCSLAEISAWLDLVSFHQRYTWLAGWLAAARFFFKVCVMLVSKDWTTSWWQDGRAASSWINTQTPLKYVQNNLNLKMWMVGCIWS